MDLGIAIPGLEPKSGQLLEMLWPPLKTALTWAIGIALGIKLLAMCLLKLLQAPRRYKQPRTKRSQGDSDVSMSGKDGSTEPIEKED